MRGSEERTVGTISLTRGYYRMANNNMNKKKLALKDGLSGSVMNLNLEINKSTEWTSKGVPLLCFQMFSS